MKNVVVTDPPRADVGDAETLGGYGVATVHEALGRVGYLGELIATALQTRGVRGFVIDGGVRDVAELREMGFPVWSALVSALGTVKQDLGDVNVPLECAGQRVEPGDVVVGDDDGGAVVPRADVPRALAASQARLEKEAVNRAAFQAGELGLDRYGMREKLADFGIEYVSYEKWVSE